MTVAIEFPQLSPISPGFGKLAGILERPEHDTGQSKAYSLKGPIPLSNYKLADARQSLKALSIEHSIDNWDGEGAIAISSEAYMQAINFIELLSDQKLPMPQFEPEVDGAIELEWYKNPSFIFTVSISGNQILGYSGYFGKSRRMYGTEPFDANLPDILKKNILLFI